MTILIGYPELIVVIMVFRHARKLTLNGLSLDFLISSCAYSENWSLTLKDEYILRVYDESN